MYGSQFQMEQALTFMRPSTQELRSKKFPSVNNKVNKKKSFSIIVVIAIALSISSLSYAGSSQPKLKGGNGNANGR